MIGGEAEDSGRQRGFGSETNLGLNAGCCLECDLEQDTWLFLASVSSSVQWVGQGHLSERLWEWNEIVDVNH